MRSLLADVETTGLTRPSVGDLDKQPKVIELGLVVVENGRIVVEKDWLINPGELITAEITKITGITNEQLEGKPSFATVIEEARAYFEFSDIFIAHNAEFDKQCITYDLQRAGLAADFKWPPETMCTVQEFMHEFGFRPKLTDLYERKMGRPLAQTHRALDDIRALAEILIKEGIV